MNIMITFLLAFKTIVSQSISCKDMKGDDVGWFTVIKTPKSSGSGEAFMYLDQSNLSMNIQSYSINDPGAISYTLSQSWDSKISTVVYK